jgi:hypothetical protein
MSSLPVMSLLQAEDFMSACVVDPFHRYARGSSALWPVARIIALALRAGGDASLACPLRQCLSQASQIYVGAKRIIA